MKDVIKAVELSKWYDDVIGLNSMDLTIKPGITGIVGPNGAGKSTFFKLIMGLLKPSMGEISVFGEKPWKNNKIHGRMGFCPDYESLPKRATGFEYLKLIGSLEGMEKRILKERINHVSKVVGMKKDLNRKIEGYSKGMKQRIKIAAALINDPKLLLLDEPLSGTDPLVRKELIKLIKSLYHEHGHNIVVSSHVLFEIERLTQNIALIYKGRTVATGNINEIRDLIDGHPHNILIMGSGIKNLAKDLIDADLAISIKFNDENELVAEVEDPNKFFDNAPSLILNSECEIDTIYSMDDNLEAVFKYLVEG
ncbi:MAG: ABC transporter ATP-binding protein [Thermoplasmatota archaeon]